MKAVKKMVTVDVWQMNSKKGWLVRPDWVLDAMDNDLLYFDEEFQMWQVNTLEGKMNAKDGDYLIKGIKGEIYPCRKDVFEESYEVTEK